MSCPQRGAADRLYADALARLRDMQTRRCARLSQDLPRYDRALLVREMELMPEWFLQPASGAAASARASAPCSSGCSNAWRIRARSQPAASCIATITRAIFWCAPKHNPGILDFQDAVWGPITYDLASLLKDCYIAWPRGARARLGA